MSSRTTQTQTANPFGPAGAPLAQGFQAAEQGWARGDFHVNPYQGPLVAGFDPLRQQAYDNAPGMVGNIQAGFGASQDALMRAMDPMARSAAWDQVRQNVIASIMPGINASFAGSGMTGSELHQQNLAKGLSAGLADAEVNAWQQGENRALAAAGMMPAIATGQMGANTYLDQIGMGMQDYNQSLIAANALQDQQWQTVNRDAIADYLTLVSGTAAPFTGQTQTSSRKPGLFDFLSLATGVA